MTRGLDVRAASRRSATAAAKSAARHVNFFIWSPGIIWSVAAWCFYGVGCGRGAGRFLRRSAISIDVMIGYDSGISGRL